MMNYAELFLGLILAGVMLFTLAFARIVGPGTSGSPPVRLAAVVADRAVDGPVNQSSERSRPLPVIPGTGR
jgi:hypothetical protein